MRHLLLIFKMRKQIYFFIALMFAVAISKAQTNAMQFNGVDCNGYNVDLFADLDAGKAVALHFYMPNCTSCPPPALAIQAMADNINAAHPGKAKGYAFPFQNSTDCAYSTSWISGNGLSFYAPMDSGALQVAYYGGFGMPTVVLLGGTDHRIMFVTQSFSISDTTIMRDSILNLLNATGINEMQNFISNVSVFPNPAKDKVQLKLNVAKSSLLNIEVVNALGSVVAKIYEGETTTGIFILSYLPLP